METNTNTPAPAALPILWAVPTLAVDSYEGTRCVTPQGAVDRRVVWNALHALACAGWVPNSIDDGDDVEPVHGDAVRAMEEIFNRDDVRVRFMHAEHPGASPWALFVLGNNGPETLSDYTTRPATFAAVLDALDVERMA